MKLTAIITAVLLSASCTTVRVVEVPAGPKITFKDGSEVQLPRAAPIQILPHAFPALVPGNSIFILQ